MWTECSTRMLGPRGWPSQKEKSVAGKNPMLLEQHSIPTFQATVVQRLKKTCHESPCYNLKWVRTHLRLETGTHVTDTASTSSAENQIPFSLVGIPFISAFLVFNYITESATASSSLSNDSIIHQEAFNSMQQSLLFKNMISISAEAEGYDFLTRGLIICK